MLYSNIRSDKIWQLVSAQMLLFRSPFACVMVRFWQRQQKTTRNDTHTKHLLLLIFYLVDSIVFIFILFLHFLSTSFKTSPQPGICIRVRVTSSLNSSGWVLFLFHGQDSREKSKKMNKIWPEKHSVAFASLSAACLPVSLFSFFMRERRS